MLGMGFSWYWRSPYDAFDGFLVLSSWLGLVLSLSFGDSTDAVGMIRALRVIRLMNHWPRMHRLGVAVVHGLPAILNVLMVFMIFLAFFAVIGVEAWGSVRYGFAVNEMANFGHFWESMNMLSRNALGSWRSIMYDLMVATSCCSILCHPHACRWLEESAA